MDLNNVIEVTEIKRLITDKNLLQFFNQIILLANRQNQIVDDTPIHSMAIEVHSEPILSDHESDSDEGE
tara:strand:- start:79 stop:285 length:207 start_codon:yes stop_codon:yes gene_type:complete